MQTRHPLIHAACLALLMAVGGLAHGAKPVTEDGVTTIHLDEYNGYFAAREIGRAHV